MLRIRHNACPACGDGNLARVDLGVIQRLDVALAEATYSAASSGLVLADRQRLADAAGSGA